jgi:hypothetical protein
MSHLTRRSFSRRKAIIHNDHPSTRKAQEEDWEFIFDRQPPHERCAPFHVTAMSASRHATPCRPVVLRGPTSNAWDTAHQSTVERQDLIELTSEVESGKTIETVKTEQSQNKEEEESPPILRGGTACRSS